MQIASSLYKGGELFTATDCDYSSSRELGLICPFCKESVFLSKGFFRKIGNKDQKVVACWKHYRVTEKSLYCEKRSLFSEGKEQLKLLQKPAQNQRLKLFNRYFWEIFKHNKVVPPNLEKTVIKFVGEEKLKQMTFHCHDRWNVAEILQAIPLKISQSLTSDVLAFLKNHPSLSGVFLDYKMDVIESFTHIEFTVLRHKILSEVVAWIRTPSGKISFAKLIQLSILDCIEVFPQPIHSQAIAEMAIMSLILTDWEKAIASIDSPTKAIGFSKI